MHDTLHRALPRLLLLFATAAPAAAQLGSMATTFADNNGRSSTPPVNLMDMTITNPAGMRFVAVDVNSMAAAR